MINPHPSSVAAYRRQVMALERREAEIRRRENAIWARPFVSPARIQMFYETLGELFNADDNADRP